MNIHLYHKPILLKWYKKRFIWQTQQMFTQQQNIYASNVCTPAQLLPLLTEKNNNEVANLHTAAQNINGQCSHSSTTIQP